MPTATTGNADIGRPNTDLAAAVDQALAMLEHQGIRAAADFLQAHGAGFRLTCRVLADPERRRAPASPAHQRTSSHHSSKRTQQ